MGSCCENGNKNDEIKNINYILAEIEIEKDDVNKDIRIINTFEESKRKYDWDYKYKNEKEIKGNCTIQINDKYITFNYLYKFTEKGKYTIKYSFKKYIRNVAFMFSECNSLTNINLSNFNTQYVTDMSWMFSKCNSLTNIDLSNFNTQNVIDMSHLFTNCKSLPNINLSNFNTQNVINMS